MIPRRIFILFVLTALPLHSQHSANEWTSGPFRIRIEADGLTISHGEKKIADALSFDFNFIPADSVRIRTARSDTLTLDLRFRGSDGYHADFPRSVTLTVSRSGNALHFFAAHPSFEHVTIRMTDLEEHYFGLIEKLYPGNDPNPDLRGRVVDVDVYGDGSRDYAENYASAYSAFYMSSAGYGAFFDTFARGRYQFAVNGITRIDHPTSGLDWHLFFGPTGDRIHEAYYRVIGRPKSVPAWACGPIFWRDVNRGGKDELLDDVKRFTELKIPLTACWVDRPYSHGGHEWSKMDFSEAFAKPAEWIRILEDRYGLRFMTWVAPMTFQDSVFPGLLPGDRGYMDLTDPAAIAEFRIRLNRHQYSAGVRGHKMDRADENFPLTAGWHDPVREAEARNKYVYLYSKTIHDFLSAAFGKDQFNFARAAFHRTQPFLSAVWGGDSRSNWQGLAGNLANSVRCGFMGFPVWGSDTGGYLGEGRIDETLYIRWLQWSAWSGLFEIKIDGSGGDGEDRPPWKYPARVRKAFRDACNLRMSLLPTIHSAANTSYRNGVLMKPLASQYPQDARTHSIWDEYLFCNAFLVAPVLSAGSRRSVYLPEGRWVDFNDPAREFAGPASIEASPSIDAIPVFLRENSIFLTGPVYRGNSRLWEGDLKGDEILVVHAFPGQPGDSTSFDYVDRFDGDREKAMRLSRTGNGVVFRSEPLASRSTVEIRCPARPVRMRLNGKSRDVRFDPEGGAVVARVPKGKPIVLELHFGG
jgi:alpha-glucosidase (family GH31 glycosyl hydrolase)